MGENYKIVSREPNLSDYRKLRKAVGWDDVNPRAAAIGLENSLYAVYITHKDEIVGCGRVIGDGGLYFYIQDVLVIPKYQGKGLGKRIVGLLLKYIEDNIYENAFIGLMAAKGTKSLYEEFGFVIRSTNRPGMYMILKR